MTTMIAAIKKRIGLKLALLFIGVLCMAMGAMVAFHAVYYADFGQQLVAENERHIKQQAMSFLNELTEQRAKRYQAVFDRLALSSRLIARQAELRFKMSSEPRKQLVDANQYLSVLSVNKLLFNELRQPMAVCYWGGRTVPVAIDREINILLPMESILAEVKQSNPEVSGSHLITTAGTAYYYPNSELMYLLPPASELDLRDTNNYVLASPRNNPERKTIWVPVYFDDVGYGLITTVTTPFFGNDGSFLGVAGMDIPIARIHRQLLERDLTEDHLESQGLFSVLLDQQGKIISFPLERLEEFGIESNHAEFKNSFDLLEKGLTDSSLDEVRTLGMEIAAKPGNTVEFILRGMPYMVSWQQLPANNWRLVTLVPQQIFLSPLQELQRQLSKRLGLLQRDTYLLTVLFFSGAMGLTLLLLHNFFIRPLRQVTLVAEQVRDGDFSPELTSERTDEIGFLTNSFGKMIAELRRGKRLEEEYAEQLERRVVEQTDLLQTQKEALEQTLDLLQNDILRRQQVELELTAAKQAADAANQAKSQFLANVTHELRTPLIGVLGMNELLAGSSLTVAQRDMVDKAQRSGEALLEIINDVLDFSKIESGDFTLSLREVEIGQVVEQAMQLMSERARQKGLALSCRIEPTAWWRVVADPVRLRQILLNLIGNAIKFTPAGEVSVALDMVEAADGCGRFMLTVRDTGIGMSEQLQAKVFAPFVQGDSSPTREFGGSGLGLAIVKQLIALMEGELVVASRVGEGSEFKTTVVLPLVAQAPSTLPENPPPLSDEVFWPMPGGGGEGLQRILIADDYALTRELVCQFLGSCQMEIDQAATGIEVIAALNEHDYDLVLMDVSMPELDGLEATRRLRAQGCRIPIIALTAHIDSQVIEGCQAAGMNDYLGKPFRRRELLEMIMKWLVREELS